MRQLKTILTLAAVLCMAAGLLLSPALVNAAGQDDDFLLDETIPAFDPADAACVEPHAPYYTHRVPVIFQDLRYERPEVVGWGYAEACAASTERMGDTFANMLERPNMYRVRYEDLLADVLKHAEIKSVAEALPGVQHPGDNALAYPLPALREIHAVDSWVDPNAREHCIGIFCLGIPPELAVHLGQEGFDSVNADDGRRWLIDSARKKWIAVAYFKSNRHDPFYAREPRFTPGPELGYGGVIRVMLNPVDFVLFGPAIHEPLAEETAISEDGLATIELTIYNASATKRQTTLGWRVQGETDWRPVHGPDNKLALEPWAEHSMTITVSGPGIEPGAVVEVMVNYDRSQIEMGPGGIEDDAYANNIGRTTLVEKSADIDLGISLKAPSQYQIPLTGQACYNVTMTVTSDAPQPVTALVRLAVDGGMVYNEYVQIPAMGARNISLCVDAGEWNRAERLEAVVDPDNAIPERNENNNRATASVQILPPPDQPGPAPESGVNVELSG